jgi:CHAT domain-containing protein
VGRHAEALPLLGRALGIAREAGFGLDEAVASLYLATSLTALGRTGEALAAAERALTLQRENGTPDDVSEGLSVLAAALARAGRLDQARAAAEEAVALTEARRVATAGTGAGGSFVGARRRRYEVLVDVLARLEEREPGRGHAAAALAVSEQAHARGLLELLRESRIDLRQGVDPALLGQEDSAAAAHAAASGRQARLAAAGTSSAAELAAAGDALQVATRELDEARARIRAHSPRYAEVVQGRILGAAEIQREAGSDGLVLEYFLGEERSYLWAVDQDGVSLHRLAGRQVLEEAARRLHRCWSERGGRAEEQRLAGDASRLLLGPVAARLRDRRLVVVADGALHYLPFAALPVPGTRERVVASHEVVNLPSMSALAALRRQVADRPAAPLAVAVVADPVFEARDPRVTGAGPRLALAALPDSLARSGRDLGLRGLERLPATRREAEAIAALSPPDQTRLAVDFGASRAFVVGGDLARYRVVHFATHGLLDNRHPELSGLVLSLVDESGAPQDGFLRTGDVFGLRLGADLVVLSACQTALGREQRGEGLVGLTRGFMYAGAPRVVASLWMVPDGATAELMRRFYQGLLAQGRPAAAALREAQRSMAADPRWSAPYAWAGFTLQGLWE